MVLEAKPIFRPPDVHGKKSVKIMRLHAGAAAPIRVSTNLPEKTLIVSNVDFLVPMLRKLIKKFKKNPFPI